MATALISVEEYLRTSYKPGCEYIDGVLRQKSLPTYDHAFVQSRLIALISALYRAYLALPELQCKIREGEYLIPDVAILEASKPQRPSPTEPIFAGIEILSPEDRVGQMLAKCEEYHAWGVTHCWVIDPERKTAWVYRKGSEPLHVDGTGDLVADEMKIPVADLFPL